MRAITTTSFDRIPRAYGVLMLVAMLLATACGPSIRTRGFARVEGIAVIPGVSATVWGVGSRDSSGFDFEEGSPYQLVLHLKGDPGVLGGLTISDWRLENEGGALLHILSVKDLRPLPGDSTTFVTSTMPANIPFREQLAVIVISRLSGGVTQRLTLRVLLRPVSSKRRTFLFAA
jgi:hypothetical protein